METAITFHTAPAPLHAGVVAPSRQVGLRPALMALLRQRLLAAGAQAEHQQLFMDADATSVNFRMQRGVVLCLVGEFHGDTGRALAPVAAADAVVDSHPPIGELACFPCGTRALETAVALVRQSSRQRWRVGLHAGECAVASFRFGGELRQVLLGEVVRRTVGLASLTVPGTIQASADGYEGLDALAARQAGCLHATEFIGDSATVVTLAPTPTRRDHGMSTFAGLGAR